MRAESPEEKVARYGVKRETLTDPPKETGPNGGTSEAQAPGNGANQTAPAPLLAIIRPTSLAGLALPDRRWIVRDWLPYGVVTGLYGDGGLGKSLLSQQLQTSTALGKPWLALAVEQVVSLGIYCEDFERRALAPAGRRQFRLRR